MLQLQRQKRPLKKRGEKQIRALPILTGCFTYTVTYEYDAAYTITGIDGYYMNNIPLTKGGNLVINANNGTGDWNDAAKDKYKIDGDMEKMFDTTVEADKVIAYNLFPQTATNGTGASTTDVKTSMPALRPETCH